MQDGFPLSSEFIIYPVDRISENASKNLEFLISKVAGGPRQVYASKRSGRKVPEYWVASLPGAGYDLLRKNPLIDIITPNEELFEDFGDYATQEWSPMELSVLSQPPGPESITSYDNYIYPSNLQRDIFIYHAERGIDPYHNDFRGRHIEFVYTGRARFTGEDDETEAFRSKRSFGHSTCTASKAIGNEYGSAKYARLVVVKMPDLTAGAIGEVFSTIADHIRDNGREGRSIVTVSWGCDIPASILRLDIIHRKIIRKVQTHLEELSNQRTWMVFSAGNSAEKRLPYPPFTRRSVIDTQPAYYVHERALPWALTVSMCDNYGERHRKSQARPSTDIHQQNIYAPGVWVTCAWPDPDSKTKTVVNTGTSL
ncbi:MAG: hypothetical protein Q9213_000789, partial [Squamulea squamosa]